MGMRRERARTEEMTAADAVERRTTRSKTTATAMMRKSFSEMNFRNAIAGHRTKKLHRSNNNTVPVTTSCIGTALLGVKSQISPNIFDGIDIRKMSKRGTIVPRVLSLSDDLFKIIVSHRMGVREAESSVIDRLRYQSIRAYETVSSVTGTQMQIKRKFRTIDVSDILFVQSGFIGSRKLESCNSQDCLDPTKVVTIFYKNFKTMDILMENEEDVSAVLFAVQLLRETYDTSKIKFARETLLLRYVWNDIDWKKSGLIKQSEFLQLLRRINVYIKKEKAIQIFRQYITAKPLKRGSTGRTTAGSMRRVSMTLQQRNGITFDECLDALKKVKFECHGRQLVTDIIFNQLFGDTTDVVTTEEFMEKFLRQKQQEHNATLENTRRLFSKLNNIEIVGSYPVEGSIDRLRFGEYLFSSPWNDGFDPVKQQFDRATLTRPFPSYWINSSHNTYLTADQFQSESSVQMYAVALQRGCKCVELDCWDDNNIGQPVVYHGYTMTSKILFQSIISCIKNYIDLVNPNTLPIVLSLENHCSPNFQQMMATILSNTLGDHLYIHEGLTAWPSPLDLVGKVLLKGGQCQKETENNDSNSLESNKSQSPRSETFKCPSTAIGISQMTLLNTVEFTSFNSSFDLPSTAMHSVDETKFHKILNNDPAHLLQWKEFNTTHMTRIYPHGSRVDSSNYNPIVAWAMGIQLVALNFQTDDSAMTVNDGRFRVCGGCGYVLKPPSVLSQLKSDNRMQLRIKILSASILPKAYGGAEVADPYVIVRLHDVQSSNTSSNDLKLKSAKHTSIVRANGFCAEWNGADCFEFLVESVGVAMMEIIVMNNDEEFIDDIISKTALPVSCLRQGYRSIQFYDNCSRQHGLFGLARLLVEVDIEFLKS